MAQGLALGQGAVAAGQGALGPADGARAAAVGAGLLVAEGLGLLLQEGREGAFGQAGGRGAGDLLHGAEIDVGAGAVGAEGVAGDDFAPAGGQLTDFTEVLGGELPARMVSPSLGLRGSTARRPTQRCMARLSARQSCSWPPVEILQIIPGHRAKGGYTINPPIHAEPIQHSA